MTLHEAILQLLVQQGSSMSTKEIAATLNRNKWYSKKNENPEITDYQIYGRARKYSKLFSVNGSVVELRDKSKIHVSEKKKVIIPPVVQRSFIDTSTIEHILLKEKNFKAASEIDEIVPDRPGIYCIKIKKTDLLPAYLSVVLKQREHSYLYLGIATKSLKVRFLGQELRAKGHGTFFRSIGAVLGYRPVKGSLKDKKNKKNYTFSPKDEQQIIKWINANLLVNWIEYKGDVEAYEAKLIEDISPLLNIKKNPFVLKELEALRTECREIANQ